jgi:hypothetical protein
VTARPPHCGSPDCDEGTRLVDDGSGGVRRCPACHPLSPSSLASLYARQDELEAELGEVRERITAALAAAEAPEWARGPGRPA